MENLATLEIAIRKEFIDFEIIKKSDSFMMKAIDLILKILTFGQMTSFMVDFVTTIGSKVYVPSRWEKWPETNKKAILRHERVHMRQCRKYTTPLFALLYLFVPVPVVFAYFRMKFEKEAYEETLRAEYEYFGGQQLDNVMYRRSIIAHFQTAQYLWMWPWRSIDDWYDETVEKIKAGQL